MNLGGIFGEIIGALIGLYIVSNIPGWHLPFITHAFVLYMPYAKAAIILTMIARICMYAFPFYRMQRLFETMATIIGGLSLYMLISIYPFDFSSLGVPMLTTIIRWCLVIALIGTCIGALTSFVRMIVGK